MDRILQGKCIGPCFSRKMFWINIFQGKCCKGKCCGPDFSRKMLQRKMLCIVFFKESVVDFIFKENVGDPIFQENVPKENVVDCIFQGKC